jgi:hypothetical protein
MYHLFTALQSGHNQPKFERVSISDNHDEGKDNQDAEFRNVGP